MFISQLKIKGLRSFGQEITITIKKDLATFIGLNSSGKTSALDALRKLFGSQGERDIRLPDFHVGKNEDIKGITRRELSIEVRIEFNRPVSDNPLDEEEAVATATAEDGQSDAGAGDAVPGDAKKHEITEEEKDAVPHFFSAMVVDEEGAAPYMRIRLEASWDKVEYDPEGILEINTYFIKVADDPDSEEVKSPLPQQIKSLFQMLYVPAIRRPAEQLKYASGSILHRVLRKIKYKDEFRAGFDEKINEINEAFRDLPEMKIVQHSITNYWSKFHRDGRYQDTSVGFGGSDFDSVLKKLEISFSPTPADRKFQVDDLGEGYRSLFYLTLVCALLEIEEKLEEAKPPGEREEYIGVTRPLMTILAIEEPENHIAPQLLGRVVGILKKLASKPNCQVFISSHTPAIVKRIPAEGIHHFRITAAYETQVNGILLPAQSTDAYKFIKEAVYNYPEIYFSKLVVIGEGDSEEVIFDRLMKVKNTDFDDNIITFAPLGHRFVNHIWKLLEHLHIPYVTLLDLDVEREGGGWGRIKYILDQLIENGKVKIADLTLTGGGSLTKEQLEKMHTWSLENDENMKNLVSWVKWVRQYHVYYSAPLDLDFCMLKNFTAYYKKAIPDGYGPKIPDEQTESEAFTAKLEGAVQATLKSKEATGMNYSEDDRKLMIWYNYHFLGRGKPSTHIHALSLISDKKLLEGLPEVFGLVFKSISELLAAEGI